MGRVCVAPAKCKVLSGAMAGLDWDKSVDNLHNQQPGKGICDGYLRLLGDLCVSADAGTGLVIFVEP